MRASGHSSHRQPGLAQLIAPWESESLRYAGLAELFSIASRLFVSLRELLVTTVSSCKGASSRRARNRADKAGISLCFTLLKPFMVYYRKDT